MVARASSFASKSTADESPPSRRRHAALEALPPAAHRTYCFTVDDYYRIAEEGILREDARVELIEGEIVMLPPIEPGHAEGAHKSQTKLLRLDLKGCDVRCQHPVRLSAISEPIPDVSVVKAKSYSKSHPTAQDTQLILEIANPSLHEDLGRKKLMYAAAAIPEYWVLDLQNHQLHAFTRPKRGDYAEHRILSADEIAQSAGLKALKVKVADLLP